MRTILLIFIFSIMVSFNLSAQMQQPVTVSKSDMSEIITSLSRLVKENYVYEEVGNKMADLINSQLAGGKYDNISNMREFLTEVQKDLVSVSHDKHFNLQFNPELAKEMKDVKGNNDILRVNEDELMKKENYAFKKVEILPGNVGYIDLRMFYFSEESKKTVDAFMNFVSNSDAVIFDMRNNGGGDPNLIKYITSYLFDCKPVHLNDLYNRVENKTEEFWTLDKVPGKRIPNIPVYVLTSAYTFSGAEEFSYNLKNLKRGTIVGETTGGGANPVGSFAITNSVVARIPVARAISPITKTNWEGVGVSPDVPVNAGDALNKAMLLALDQLSAKANDPQWKKSLDWSKLVYEAKLSPYSTDKANLEKMAGDYGRRLITFENGELMYKNKMWPASKKMISLSKDTYMIESMDDVIVKFAWDGDKVKGINIIPMNAPEDYAERTN